MAGSTGPPKKKKGRPKGAFNKGRDYRAAVARVRALRAGGASRKEALATVTRETNIPESTIRKHIYKKPRGGPRFSIHAAMARTLTEDEARQASERSLERQRQLDEARAEKEEARLAEMMRQLGLPVPPRPTSKKKRE